jgi:hypothetical protein
MTGYDTDTSGRVITDACEVVASLHHLEHTTAVSGDAGNQEPRSVLPQEIV